MADGGLFASFNAYSQLLETLTEKSGILASQKGIATQEYKALHLEHLRLQADKYGLTAKAALLQETLIKLQIEEESNAASLLDATLAFQQLKLRASLGVVQSDSCKSFSLALDCACATTATSSTSGELAALAAELEIIDASIAASTAELAVLTEAANVAERSACEAAARAEQASQRLAKSTLAQNNGTSALAALKHRELIAHSRASALRQQAAAHMAEESRVDIDAAIAAAACEELEQQLLRAHQARAHG